MSFHKKIKPFSKHYITIVESYEFSSTSYLFYHTPSLLLLTPKIERHYKMKYSFVKKFDLSLITRITDIVYEGIVEYKTVVEIFLDKTNAILF